jgi:hypothetical protein
MPSARKWKQFEQTTKPLPAAHPGSTHLRNVPQMMEELQTLQRL